MKITFVKIIRLILLQVIALGYQKFLTDYFSYQIGYYYPKYEGSDGIRVIVSFIVSAFMICVILFVAWLTWR